MDIFYFAIIGILLLIIVSKDMMYRKIQQDYAKERQDLLNRIMSKDIIEYSSVTNNTLPRGSNPIKKVNDFEGLYED